MPSKRVSRVGTLVDEGIPVSERTEVGADAVGRSGFRP
ncbi:hypothetical protein I546_5536 [Mycobacterium kansasii 732]|nr:hypothetical protein I546_5536 [Mycobacterium kansasii 732]